MHRELGDGMPSGIEVCTAEPTPIFVCGAAQTHAVHLQAGATSGDLRAAVTRMGYSAAETRLCVVGGAPLPLDDRLTLAQCGIRANSSVQVAGRLRGGVEVTIGGRQHAIDARGHLDLSEKNLGPAEVREVASFLATSAGGAVDVVNVSQNPIGVDGAKALAAVLPGSSLKCLIIGPKSTRLPVNDAEVTELNFEGQDFTALEVTLVAAAVSTMGAVEAVDLAKSKLGGRTVNLAPGATAIDAPVVGCFVKPLDDELFFEVTSLEPVRLKSVADGQMLDDAIPLEVLQSDEVSLYAAKDGIIAYPFADFCKSLKTSRVTSLNLSECELGSDDLAELAEYVRDATAAIAHLALGSNPIGDEAMIPLLDTLKDIPGVTYEKSVDLAAGGSIS
eukprot:COSAG03_NODE_312_length_9111_cov_63.231392_5_plen_390_part_00